MKEVEIIYSVLKLDNCRLSHICTHIIGTATLAHPAVAHHIHQWRHLLTRQLLKLYTNAATSIPAPPVSATLSPTTPVSPHHPTIYYYWDAHSWSANPTPADTKSWSPSAVSDTIKSPSPLFGFFIARITKVDHHTPPSCMNGHVSGLEEGLRGGKQSPQLKAVKDEGLDEAALELNGSNRRISCDKWSAWQPKHQQTSLHKADCSYPLVVSHIEAKAQNGICPEKGVF